MVFWLSCGIPLGLFYPLLGLDRSSSTSSSIFLPEDLCLAACQCSESQTCKSLIHPHVLLWNPATSPITSQPGDFCFPFSRLLPEEGGAVIWEGSCSLTGLSTYLPVSSLPSSQLPAGAWLLPLPQPDGDSAV